MAPKQQPVSVFQTFTVAEHSPFNLEKLSDKFRHRVSDWTIPQAFLCILIETAMADGSFDDEEAEEIKRLARRSRALNSLDPNELASMNAIVNERRENRPEALREACATLPADMCLPVFAHCVEIVLSDGELLKTEADFLQNLMTMLDIDQDNARRVMEVLLLKNQY